MALWMEITHKEMWEKIKQIKQEIPENLHKAFDVLATEVYWLSQNRENYNIEVFDALKAFVDTLNEKEVQE